MSNLLKDNKKLMKEYNYRKNEKIDLNTITIGSRQKIWWICFLGHEWEATISNRVRGNNCPYCSNRKILVGYNDLATIKPNLLAEWNYTKNIINPENVGAGSSKVVWWKCSKGHEWEEQIRRRTQGLGCPYCSGHRVLKGYNDLTTTHPELIKEWDYEHNEVNPEEISRGSNIKVWWKCQYGHRWQTTIDKRTKGNNCPICSSYQQTSFAEQAIYYYVKKKYKDTESRYKKIFENNMEIDIYIPNKKIGIEYDGKHYHKSAKSKLREKEKYSICQKEGIRLIRVKETPEKIDKNCDLLITTEWKGNNYSDLDNTIRSVLELLKVNINVDSQKDRFKIIKLYKENRMLLNSISDKKILKEWDYEKNDELSPEMFTKSSGIRVWWKCSKCHNEWETTIAKRVSGNGCPYCSGRNPILGKTDLKTINPIYIKEWDYEKNNGLSPEMFKEHSNKKIWWKCSKGHEWEATIARRSSGKGCPYCANKKILKGYNDLATTNKKLFMEWNYEKNINISPYKVNDGSGKKVWWKCSKCGHEWEATIVNRSKRNHDCPKCGIEKIRKSKNKATMQISLDGKIIKIYSSAKEAEEETGIKHISDVCNGKREIAGGYKWKYQEEKNESRNN